MFIFKLYKYMQIRIFHIKALFGQPIHSRHSETDTDGNTQSYWYSIYLFGENIHLQLLPDGFAIYFGIKCQFDWIYNVFVKL